jgi:hypothetical protein
MAPPDDEAFRAALREVLLRSGRSMRGLSAAMGRDPGYIAALLDPTRPARARPNPTDLRAAADATGIPFVELLEALWGIDRARLASELGLSGELLAGRRGTVDLTAAERAELDDFAAFVVARHARHQRRGSSTS